MLNFSWIKLNLCIVLVLHSFLQKLQFSYNRLLYAGSNGYVSESTDTQQPFTTPNFPDVYPNNADIEWKFTAPAGRQVKLVVINGSSETCCDILRVFAT